MDGGGQGKAGVWDDLVVSVLGGWGCGVGMSCWGLWEEAQTLGEKSSPFWVVLSLESPVE